MHTTLRYFYQYLFTQANCVISHFKGVAGSGRAQEGAD